ncbi:MAG: AraC family transcriptional regulator [Ruminococcus sp.]|jgi:AraC-like DNA-binding protein|nr:AraC family transcriptional regulator [Ruminococcus sp.]
MLIPREYIENNQSGDFYLTVDKNETEFSCGAHWHEHLEIIYMLDYSISIIIGNENRTLKTGDIVIINPMEVHSTMSNGDSEFLLIQIPYDFLVKCVPKISKLRMHCENTCQDVKDILDEIVSVYYSDKWNKVLKIQADVFDLLYILSDKYSTELNPSEIPKTEKYTERLSLILQYVNENYAKHITLDDVAGHAALATTYFAKFFKKYMGITFMEYLALFRLDKIYQDMKNTDYSISELCEKNGFTNYKLFVRLFKERFGVSPKTKLKEFKTK